MLGSPRLSFSHHSPKWREVKYLSEGANFCSPCWSLEMFSALKLIMLLYCSPTSFFWHAHERRTNKLKQGDSFYMALPSEKLKYILRSVTYLWVTQRINFLWKILITMGGMLLSRLSAKRKDVEALYGSNFLALLTGNKDYFTTQVKYFCYNLTPLPYIGTV